MPEFSGFEQEMEAAKARIRAEYEPHFVGLTPVTAMKLRRRMAVRLWWEKVRLITKHCFMRRRVIR